MNSKSLNYTLASRSTFLRFAKQRRPAIDYTKPVRHAYTPFGKQCTLLYDLDYPLLERLVGYEQRNNLITGEQYDYCTSQRHVSHLDNIRNMCADYYLDKQRQRTRAVQQLRSYDANTLPAVDPDSSQHLLAARSAPSTLLRPTPEALDLCTTPTASSQYYASIMSMATVPSQPTTDEPEDIVAQIPEEHVNNIPADHLPENASHAADIRDILLSCSKAFSLYKFDIGTLDLDVFGYARIDTGDSKPHNEPNRRYSHLEREALHERVLEYRMQDICEDVVSSWNSNPLMVPKKDTQVTKADFRLCLDLRGVNNLTRIDSHPLPRIDDIISVVKGAKYITTIDIKSAFNAFLIHPDDRAKTSFYAGDFGKQQMKRLSMGLRNAPSQFQRVMDQMMSDFVTPDATTPGSEPPFLRVYLDDLIVFSTSWESHCRHVRLVVQRLQKHNLKINAEKSLLGPTRSHVLRQVISGDTNKPNPKLCDTINTYLRPRAVKHVQRFLGMCNFFREYIPQYAPTSPHRCTASLRFSPANDALRYRHS